MLWEVIRSVRIFYASLCLAMRMIGGANEHIHFLLLRALELQGEVQEAYGHAVVYKTLDPKVSILTEPLAIRVPAILTLVLRNIDFYKRFTADIFSQRRNAVEWISPCPLFEKL